MIVYDVCGTDIKFNRNINFHSHNPIHLPFQITVERFISMFDDLFNAIRLTNVCIFQVLSNLFWVANLFETRFIVECIMQKACELSNSEFQATPSGRSTVSSKTS